MDSFQLTVRGIPPRPVRCAARRSGGTGGSACLSFIGALALILASSRGLQATNLYSFGPDISNDPRSFTSINTNSLTASPLYNMTDVNDGFNGGVTYRASTNLFYAIINDSSGNSSLISFALGGAGTFSVLQSVGVGFMAGLTFDTANNSFYAINANGSGFSSLNKINLGGATNLLFGLGNGFTGGLTFDSADGNLYAISSDSFGNSTLNRITLGGSVVALSGALGTGFVGGVAYDSQTNSFYAIDTDTFGNSTLDRITVSGSSATETPLFSIGQGFVNAGLTEAAPEPGTIWLFACGAAGLLVCRRKIRF